MYFKYEPNLNYIIRNLVIDSICENDVNNHIITVINEEKEKSEVFEDNGEIFYIQNESIVMRENDNDIFINKRIHEKIVLKFNLDIDDISKIYKSI